MSAEEREVLTWQGFGDASRELAQAVANSGFRPDVVVAIARGGLPVGAAISYALGTKGVGTMNVEFYTDIDERLPAPIILPPLLDTAYMKGLKVLIADDVADTGHTLALVRDYVTPQVGEVRSAVLYQKPISVIDCEYVWRHTDQWIDFPWSTKAALVNPHESDAHKAE